MGFIEITKEEIVNVAIIDRQHDNIAQTVNDIHNSWKVINSNVENLITKLLENLEIHFETEEKLMKENNFEGYFSHKLEHDRFFKQILQIADKLKKGSENLNEDILNNIRRWFFNHIKIKDKKCGEFLNSIGIS